MRLLLYTGKGGVGKTTTAAATAVHCARQGRRTLVLSADAAHSLGDVVGRPLAPQPILLEKHLSAVEVDARVELERYWGNIREYLVALFRHQGIEEVVAEELALLPGAEELTTLLAVERYARSGRYDVIIVDCAPTDSTLRLVTLPEVAHTAIRLLLRLQRALTTLVGPIASSFAPLPLPSSAVFRDAEKLVYKRLRALRRRLVSDDTSVRIVLTPERMVIDEARRAYTDLCLFDLACDAVVMNRLYPAHAGEEAFFRDWLRVQAERRAEVAEQFAPLALLDGMLARDELIGLEALAEHGARLFGRLEPDARLAIAPRVRFTGRKLRKRDRGDAARVRSAIVPLPGAEARDVQVAKLDGELIVSAGGHRRAIKLPRGLAKLRVVDARCEAGELTVEFGAPPEPEPALRSAAERWL